MHVDEAVLQELEQAVGGPEVLLTLLETFQKELHGLAQQVDAGARGRDIDKLRRAFHTMASNAAMFGAMETSTKWRAAEMAADGPDWGIMNASIESVHADVAAIVEAFAHR